MAKTITLTLSQYLLMSEAHIKNLVSQGFNLDIEDIANTSKEVAKQPVAAKAAYQPKTNKVSSDKVASKGSKKPTKALAFGNVKDGDYFKVVVNDKITFIGKAEKVDNNSKLITAVGQPADKKWDLTHSVKISEKTFGKLAKRKALKKLAKRVNNPTVSTSKKLTATDYKLVYAFYLKKIGKIDDNTFAKAKDSAEVRSELYKQFKETDKLSNKDALKIFAENAKTSNDTANA